VATTTITRLREAVTAAAPGVTSVSVGRLGDAATVRVQPAALQAAAQATIDAFDWSAAAEQTWLGLRDRNTAVARCSDATELGKLVRAIAGVIADELNVLRQQVVGVATFVWDPPGVTNATGATSANVTVTGARFGDAVDVAAPYSLQGLTVTGYVAAADTVNVRIHNGTGGAVNLASGTWGVCVRRPQAMADRTLALARAAVVAKLTSGLAD
jgi:hypothetical protein